MVQLVLIYCMAAHATVCRENRPFFADQMTMMSCMLSAQPLAAHYVREHPKWALQSYRCELNKPQQAHA